MTSVQNIVSLLDEALWHGFTVFLRIAAISSLLPAFGEQSVPVRVKLAIALAFTAVVAPAIETADARGDLTSVTMVIMSETVSGFLIGIGFRLFILALQTAGSIAAQSTSLSQVLGGSAVDPLPAMGYILVIAGIALSVIAGLHVKVAQLIITSYDFLPYGRFPNGSFVSEWGTRQVAYAFYLAFTLAAPFLVVSVLYNLALGAINRAMPQLMVAFVGAPLITLGGLALLAIASPFMITVWLQALEEFASNPMRARP